MNSSIVVNCPWCRVDLHIHSDIEKDVSDAYNIKHVPIDIAMELEDKPIRCISCDSTWIFHSFVACSLETPEEGRYGPDDKEYWK